ncbi:hypothetical protein HU200_006094 [Digitaria exilis]|uniref:Pre-mRNA-splicing factor SYF2 n=1 Tax=Digitaria exilis TaxID=1010633 RepID=A0A835KVU4_9POAL|nr:hypothetical protein HU200_006094 [Digitaria exilis]
MTWHPSIRLDRPAPQSSSSSSSGSHSLATTWKFGPLRFRFHARPPQLSTRSLPFPPASLVSSPPFRFLHQTTLPPPILPSSVPFQSTPLSLSVVRREEGRAHGPAPAMDVGGGVRAQGVNPDCPNAANPFHRCAEYCPVPPPRGVTKPSSPRPAPRAAAQNGTRNGDGGKRVVPAAAADDLNLEEAGAERAINSPPPVPRHAALNGTARRDEVECEITAADDSDEEAGERVEEHADVGRARRSAPPPAKGEEKAGGESQWHGVNPDCPNAANPFHRCAEYCPVPPPRGVTKHPTPQQRGRDGSTHSDPGDLQPRPRRRDKGGGSGGLPLYVFRKFLLFLSPTPAFVAATPQESSDGDGKKVDPRCPNAPNPFHVCTDHCLAKMAEAVAIIPLHSPLPPLLVVLGRFRKVDPKCPNAANPFHECGDHCAAKMQQVEPRKGASIMSPRKKGEHCGGDAPDDAGVDMLGSAAEDGRVVVDWWLLHLPGRLAVRTRLRLHKSRRAGGCSATVGAALVGGHTDAVTQRTTLCFGDPAADSSSLPRVIFSGGLAATNPTKRATKPNPTRPRRRRLSSPPILHPERAKSPTESNRPYPNRANPNLGFRRSPESGLVDGDGGRRGGAVGGRQCSDYCLRKIAEARQRLDDELPDSSKRPPEQRTVHPDCINASNPYHDCSEYCFKRIADAKSGAATDPFPTSDAAEQQPDYNDAEKQEEAGADDGYPQMTEKQKKLFELRLKMNEARKANQQAMVAEKKRMEPRGEKENIDKMVKELKDREEKRQSFSRRRKFNEDKDIDSINDRNEHFNKKIERAFGKYTLEIKNNLERGTALPD